jgi:alpha-glucosidase (family GH31 glycosyl hydrolase)
MSVSGLGYIHSDAGGFAQGVKDDELYTRWLQFAAFTPVFRPHGSGIPSEPVYWSEQTQNIVRKYINLRYSMLPYNYTLAYRNATLGEPLMKPLFYVYDDTLAANREDEYLWGNEILVAPILKPGENHHEVYLPAGNWYDFHTGEIVSGAKTIAVNLTISDIPLFVKAGSFIPFTETLPTTSLYKADNYRIRYYPQGESEFVQYEDDGMDNLALSAGRFELIKYKGIQTTDKVTISIEKQGSWKGMPTERKICMEIRLDKLPRLVSINGKRLKQSKKSKNSSYSFDGQWLRVYYTWNGYPTTIKIDQ